MRRLLVAVLALSLCLSPILPTVGAVPDARMTVSDVTVAPDRPTPDEPTTVTATVALSVGSDSPVELDRVVLEDDDGDRITSASDPGSLSPGDDLTVDLVAEFAEAGRHDLTVVARGSDASGRTVEVERPVTVVVEDSPPQIDIDAALVEGVASDVTVDLANPSVDDVRNVEVAVLQGDSVADSGSLATLAPGENDRVNLSVTPTGDDDSFAVRVSYTTATGDRQTTVLRENLRVDALRDDVEIDVRPVRAEPDDGQPDDALGGLIGGGGDALQGANDDENDPGLVEVAVTNFGNSPISEAVVEPSGEEPLPRSFLGGIDPGETETATLDLSDVPPGELDVSVSYLLDREERRVSTAYDHRPDTAAIRVTDADVSRDGDRITITGNAGNTGETSVTGVVLSINGSETVRPAYPQRDYFVGTVDGSEFAPFELTARVDENASTVHVDATYRVDGREVVETTALPLEDDGDTDGGFFSSVWPFALGAGVSALVGLGVLVPLYYRRR